MAQLKLLDLVPRPHWPSTNQSAAFQACRLLIGQRLVRSIAGWLTRRGPQLANDTVAEIRDEALGFLEATVNRVRREALRCGPVAGVYDGLLVATCDHIGAPLVSDVTRDC